MDVGKITKWIVDVIPLWERVSVQSGSVVAHSSMHLYRHLAGRPFKLYRIAQNHDMLGKSTRALRFRLHPGGIDKLVEPGVHLRALQGMVQQAYEVGQHQFLRGGRRRTSSRVTIDGAVLHRTTRRT
eukprot:UN2855